MKPLVAGGAGFIGPNYSGIAHRPFRDAVVNVDLLTYAGDRSSLDDVERDYLERYAFVAVVSPTQRLSARPLLSTGPMRSSTSQPNRTRRARAYERRPTACQNGAPGDTRTSRSPAATINRMSSAAVYRFSSAVPKRSRLSLRMVWKDRSE